MITFRGQLTCDNLFRSLFSTSTRLRMSNAISNTPVEDAIREKLTSSFSPSTLTIRNDSHHHAHHSPMQGVTSKETHFHVTITSTVFQSKTQPTRHRMVYALLKDEMSRGGGIHALQLQTRTPEEEERRSQNEHRWDLDLCWNVNHGNLVPHKLTADINSRNFTFLVYEIFWGEGIAKLWWHSESIRVCFLLENS